MPPSSSTTISVAEYHRRTKHHLNRYAAGPGGLDWADQPDPFRRFIGCERIALPKPGAGLASRFNDLGYSGKVPKQPLNAESLGLLLELAFGLSAWKQYGTERWALRCNPSSGNLHPTEAYVINTGETLLPPGIYHYVSYDHALEQRCRFSKGLSDAGLYVALSSIHWREAWKYGERAYRYCQHDIGHALGSLRYGAAALGWTLELMAEWSDVELGQLLGLNRSDDFIDGESESPDLICRILSDQNRPQPSKLSVLLQHARTGKWCGQAARLSAFHRNHWPVIDQIARETQKPHTDEPFYRIGGRPPPKRASQKMATAVIRQRRSAQRFDALTMLPASSFASLINAVMPANPVPFDVWRWPPRVHLLLFVHRVENLDPGLYLLPRRPEAADQLRAAISREYDWQAVAFGDIDRPLHRLIAADCRNAAKTVSCHQDIAGDGAFSVAMLAEFQQPLNTGPWHYRRLFWETGLIGQALYLEAEAAGMRGTGIGCFFDDSVHDLLGLKDAQFQSLYHFTVGQPLDDLRLQTLPAYSHL